MNEHFGIFWGTRRIRRQQVALYLACAVKQLKGMGIKPLDRVAICDENNVEYVVLLLALWQIKAVAVPISPRWPDKTIAAYMAKINARHLLRCADIKRIVCYDARQNLEAGDYKDLGLDQEVSIIATSGSSGLPKAVVHTWGNHFYSAQGSNEIIPLAPADRWLLSLPLYHVSGLAVVSRCLLSGAGLVIVDEGDLIVAAKRSQATHVSLVATQLQKLLLEAKNLDVLRSFKCILLGGSAIPPVLVEQSFKSGLNIYLSYGLTEMASQVATGKVADGGKACVRVLPYRQLSISSSGEVLVKGEVLFKGYAAGDKLYSLLADGWFSTGDMGYLDKNGCLTVTGRRDNMFISGGENIHPEEIEKALLSINGIAEAVVVPKEDKEYGHRPIAFIKFTAAPLPEDHIIRCLETDLPRFKIPVAFFPWPQNLMDQGIKIFRQEFLKALPHR
ncbi:MAG: o-succinylbenzoate--CoA ligase [Candidatus Omnitrophica bacterium]|nr:o-succinylbenzoate--CoA ligase [Candidatus Omnitrophota bacterium]MDE2008781.1 o-succinylbenzoate--CoA ligase [Candidatus Omnitrophota bacterium]MDE2213656.1 o-succinylbenzoate--CoA ligase [Candidatus Omnitrophota bacterium]MDE2230443.1 o-succinylbenzoate--CoA ligase [Candidatus Omnitrophota bacterium]